MKFAIFVNITRDKALELARELTTWMEAHSIDYAFDPQSAKALDCGKWEEKSDLSQHCDAFVALGGDGTLLLASHYSRSKPVVGINVGDLGFLTEFSPDEMWTAMDHLVSGNYSIHTRSQLEATLESGELLTSLNDVIIEKGSASRRLPAFTILLDDEMLGSYRADGIIIATSTGSTAYSLSAGGPIIAPKSNVFVITPICPHMLTVRPIVISDDKTVKVSVDSQSGEFPLKMDGIQKKLLVPGEVVTVKKSPYHINLVANEKRNYCEILRKKLLWSHEHPTGE
ncbi:NAD(+)/NADH kinase [Chlorobaculum thiosulfatiphilum]|jgi:NAD+ kinase|uniref:NAD kinase n=1 Tax=Chlorobaculum thiosulfatiphilum TaxID=115852 RepID=A0A5C4S6Y5_CHLTI|nr:NAD(+)/NADH kinase [Chlorobaculum thiosulfatiphilum]TNJ39012.1 NAD(+)/NADH kinase [Chlorobaculum thiosulfatiphilum]